VSRVALLALWQRHWVPLQLAFLYAAFGALALGSWRAWGDPHVDFPQELAVPWQLSRGEVLYRDVLHYYGPLSQYWHSLLFRAFGPSYTVVIASNVAVCLALIALVHTFFRRFGSKLLAASAGAVFALLVPVAQLTRVGGYNFLSPYKHEATHGTLLVVACALLAARSLRAPGTRELRAAALLAGLGLLTKPEMFLAGGALLGAALGYRWLLRTPPAPPTPRLLAALAACAAAPALVAYAAFRSALPPRASLEAALGAVAPLFVSDIAANPIYERVLGSDDVAGSLAATLAACGVVAAVSVAGALGAALEAQLARPAARAALAAGLGLAALALASRFDLLGVSRALGVLTLLYLLLLALGLRRAPVPREETMALALWGVFSLCFLLKMLLAPGLHWLGFYLGFPALLFVLAVNVWWLPAWLEARGGGSRAWTAVWLGFLAAFTLGHVQTSQAWLARKTYPLGQGADRMLAFPTAGVSVPARVLAHVLARVEAQVPPDATLWVLPENALLNYLARRDNPTPYQLELMVRTLYDYAGGAPRILATLEAHPPDYVIYLKRANEVRDPGYAPRGPGGFAEPVYRWIDEHYAPVEQLGPDTADFDTLVYKLLKRKS
jgi:hypothetical protein